MSNKVKIKFVCDCGKKYEVRRPTVVGVFRSREREIKCECGRKFWLYKHISGEYRLEVFLSHEGNHPIKQLVLE